jgi:hypothetical protein
MGLWKRLFGGADGARDAMRVSYFKHRRLAEQGRAPTFTSDPPHYLGLYGALGTRYKARLQAFDEAGLWIELAPFLLIREAEAVEALAEYVLWKEGHKDARVRWLREVINATLCGPVSPQDDRAAYAVGGIRSSR